MRERLDIDSITTSLKILLSDIKTIRTGQKIYLTTTKESTIIYRAMLLPMLTQMATVSYAITEYIIFYIRHQKAIEQNERLEFVFLSLPFVDLTKSPYYELTAIYGVLISTPLMMKICGINSLMLGLTCHLSGLYRSLASDVFDTVHHMNLKKLKFCIQKHIKILR
jgi:hypothetical protein